MTGSRFGACAALALIVLGGAPALANDPAYDGLVPIEGARVASAYIDPEADFSVFTRIRLLEPYVAFRANWQRDQNRSRSRNISQQDMDAIRADVARLFLEVFRDRLQANDGFEVVDVAGDDVLAVRPAILDLDITAPDVDTAARSRNLTASTGAATIYIELVDSVTGDLLGRAADRTVVRSTGGSLAFSNRVTNTAEARRMFRRWADLLRGFLDEHYMKH